MSFVGLNLLNDVVMVEYELDPPLRRLGVFGPELLCLTVTDDVSEEPYPTAWEDWPWRERGPGRFTTRLTAALQRPHVGCTLRCVQRTL